MRFITFPYIALHSGGPVLANKKDQTTPGDQSHREKFGLACITSHKPYRL
ncbi:hypothetical protein [Allofournierella sp. CML151]|nr:hypothetical protein [Fournierella sp. CML151]